MRQRGCGPALSIICSLPLWLCTIFSLQILVVFHRPQTRTALQDPPNPGADNDDNLTEWDNVTYILNATGDVCNRSRPLPKGTTVVPQTALLSLPGSGNTWLRWLIERLTGVCTGSVYHDAALKKAGFVCEGRQHGVMTVKTHFVQHLQAAKTILLIRNPYDALVAEFKRVASGGNHTGVTTTDLYHSRRFHVMVHELGATWLPSIRSVVSSPGSVLVAFFERLKDDPQRELRRLARFLLVRVDTARVRCVMRSLNGPAKRSRTPQDVNKGYSKHSESPIKTCRIICSKHSVSKLVIYRAFSFIDIYGAAN
ncbi:WSCD family member GA21586-like isoform X2 [Paramacrobiotus metropolitanus]|uniref:WSCD family member GA21586-like isoform X2 n=1 Tax=Paramacrobiotus metropolitanus TaxID=2943436 RepID=UPI00244563EA|nr:WSCD family member GA21586-like isoform X2 [Paramacrobiotus metropolitanus]